MGSVSVWSKGSRALLEGLESAQFSRRELWQHAHERAISTNVQTRAFYEIYDTSSVASETKEALPLGGAPVAVKDFIFTKSHFCSAGSKMLEGFRAPYNATCVERLLQGGASLLGRTSMDEFGMGSSNENSVQGPVMNPWDLSKSPGGSSGGSAAAVASGAAPFALGTDTGGSVRQPASFCGVTGLKPSYGRVSRFGVISFASSLDQVGTFALDAYGCAKLLENISGEDSRDPTSSRAEAFAYRDSSEDSIKGLRIAVPDFVEQVEMDDDVRRSFGDFKQYLQSRGALIETVPMPLLEYSLPVYYLICTSEASSNLSRYDGVHLGNVGDKNVALNKAIVSARSAGFGAEVKRRILLGTFALSAGYRDAFFNKAAKVRRMIKDSYETILGEYDLVLTPTSFETAFSLGDRTDNPLKMYDSDRLTIAPSLAGLPALSFPVPSQGMPVGMQFVAPHFSEQKLIRVVDQYQSAQDGFMPTVAPLAGTKKGVLNG